MKFAPAYPLTPRTLSMNVTWSVTALVGMLCVSGSGVGVGVGACASAAPALASANAPAARHAPASALTRRVERSPPYNVPPLLAPWLGRADRGPGPLMPMPPAPLRACEPFDVAERRAQRGAAADRVAGRLAQDQ